MIKLTKEAVSEAIKYHRTLLGLDEPFDLEACNSAIAQIFDSPELEGLTQELLHTVMLGLAKHILENNQKEH